MLPVLSGVQLSIGPLAWRYFAVYARYGPYATRINAELFRSLLRDIDGIARRKYRHRATVLEQVLQLRLVA